MRVRRHLIRHCQISSMESSYAPPMHIIKSALKTSVAAGIDAFEEVLRRCLIFPVYAAVDQGSATHLQTERTKNVLPINRSKMLKTVANPPGRSRKRSQRPSIADVIHCVISFDARKSSATR